MKDNRNDAEEKKPETVNVNVSTPQDKAIPKFCTTINIALLKSKNVVFTMAYSEGLEHAAVIDRIVIDLDHAKQLSMALDQLLKESENV